MLLEIHQIDFNNKKLLRDQIIIRAHIIEECVGTFYTGIPIDEICLLNEKLHEK